MTYRTNQPGYVLTKHASIRLQQRGIPAWFLALLVHTATRSTTDVAR